MVDFHDLKVRVISAPRPWLVMDLSTLEAMNVADGLPEGFSVVVPDRLFTEVAHRDEERQRRLLDKFIRLSQHPNTVGRLLVGDYWREIARRETVPDRIRAGSLAAIEYGFSMHWIDAQLRGSIREDALMTLKPEDDDKDAGKQLFIDEGDIFLEWFLRTQSRSTIKLARSKNTWCRIALVRGMNNLVANAATRRNSRKYRRAAWQGALRRYPSRAAAARWERLRLWYFLDRVYRPTTGHKKLGNDYDDLHYAFLSLYTRHLWTYDKGLKAAAESVESGRVKVHFQKSNPID